MNEHSSRSHCVLMVKVGAPQRLTAALAPTRSCGFGSLRTALPVQVTTRNKKTGVRALGKVAAREGSGLNLRSRAARKSKGCNGNAK
jgi:hypothetical protein